MRHLNITQCRRYLDDLAALIGGLAGAALIIWRWRYTQPKATPVIPASAALAPAQIAAFRRLVERRELIHQAAGKAAGRSDYHGEVGRLRDQIAETRRRIRGDG
ncbi:hypothetical protein [Nocardioides bruguierae]|uniref:Uncharacterized protein n=1 Tax=Nocardioides bruguierae TaxID=2945102 RepID=A0A9X2IH55_9ACTN|nr:hypothetical protein [Nocardioides bruguierae]MCM0622703.1 hypothetical protein [Nocardioides bruguierae]